MKKAPHVLIIEDTASLAMTYAGQLEAAGCSVELAGSGGEARQHLDSGSRPFDVILLDLKLPDCDGLEWLSSQPGLTEKASVIVITADGSINRAIQAMRLGAYDFLVKPLSPERLLTTVRHASERRELEREVQIARKLKKRDRFHGFVGHSDVMQAVYRAIENVANSKATVFVTGESGTGKEVTAEAIHNSSQRASGRFVAINCGAIPENLLESELFGHVKGAFTGALENRTGAAKEADGGTLFLDEICEMELKLQVKLLRFLQTGMIQRVGSSKPEAVNVRVICATNRDPMAEVAAGRFREDLFYRLSVLPIELPPLRERGDDIVLLAQTFLDRFAEEEGKTFNPLDIKAQARLKGYGWPGNVRELQNVIRRAVVMTPEPDLSADAILQGLSGPAAAPPPRAQEASTEPGSADGLPASGNGMPDLSAMTLDEIEKWAVEAAIAQFDGSVPAAARHLAISPSTLYRKLERWSNPVS
ncbi:sigma-54-dependent transcriptional regulator [Novosphingobium beihaiensis]|uniref:Sigma-54 dependent transcriptional regulator n=1 Tax=Novosphingobium beihaiensis TaxID=2930389 RepID=A0ABT0BUY1_9SPHN|nr:sigma-54 dependent transcriptional regulator [Novosphingobium beihaiensis]MCJ2188854.1 sigma-54 dependent transcriptional regulator [Novosphingobium beihaiensis]